MKNHFTLYIPIWDTNLHILDCVEDLEVKLQKLDIEEDDIKEIIDDSCEAITFCNHKGAGIIVLKNEMDYELKVGTIAHEVFHAVQEMLHVRGVKLRNGDSNESHAYLIGYIMEHVVKNMSKD